jgi:hypothetical protein
VPKLKKNSSQNPSWPKIDQPLCPNTSEDFESIVSAENVTGTTRDRGGNLMYFIRLNHERCQVNHAWPKIESFSG